MAAPVGTILCSACGAAVPRTSDRCGYCGATVVLPPPVGAEGPAERRTFCPRCGLLYPSAARRCPLCPPGATDERGGRCPRCGEDLEPVGTGRAVVDRCRGCGGHWFDGDEMEQTFDLTTQGASREDAQALRRGLPRGSPLEEEVRYLACVRCGERMARRQVVPGTGLVVDVCRPHGVWFDGGELDRFLAFVRAGGLEVFRHDGIAAAQARAQEAAGGAVGLGLGGPTVGAPLSDALRALLGLIRGGLR